jgi:hypothetical protein
MMLYQNKIEYEKKKYAFKYWKVIQSSMKSMGHKKSKPKIIGYGKPLKTLHTKQFTFMNSEDFEGMSNFYCIII